MPPDPPPSEVQAEEGPGELSLAGSSATAQAEYDKFMAGLASEARKGQEPGDEGEEDGAQDSTEEQKDPGKQAEEDKGKKDDSAAEKKEADEFVDVELPEGVADDIQALSVPKEAEPVIKALVEAARTGPESAKEELEVQQLALQQQAKEYEDAARALFADPFRVFAGAFGERTEEAEKIFELWIMEDEDRWKRHLDFLASVDDPREKNTAVGERRLLLNQRIQAAQQIAATEKQVTQARAVAEQAVRGILEKVPDQAREIVQRGLINEINIAAEQNGGIATPQQIAEIAKPWLQHFSAKLPDATAEETKRKIKEQAASRKKLRAVVRPGGEAGPAFKQPKKGTTLDDISKQWRAGKLSVG